MVRSRFLLFLAFLALVGSNVTEIDSNTMGDETNFIKIDVSPLDGDPQLSVSNFEGFADGALSKGFLDIFGFIADLIGIYDFIKSKSDEDVIREGFKQLESQLTDIQQTLHDIINIIKDQAIRTQYASAERVITESIRCYNAYLNMTTQEGKEYWRKEFLQNGGNLRESVSFLLDGMLGREIFAGDLLLTVVDTEGFRAGRVTSRINNFMGLINSGIWIHAAYAQVYPISNETNAPFHSLIESSYAEIANRVKAQIVICEDEDKVPDQMAKLMKEHSGQKPYQLIKTLFNYLTDRYDTKYWFVIVYDPLTGYDKHSVSRYFHYVFRQGGRNAVATSFPVGREYRFSKSQRDFINKFPCNNYKNAQSGWKAIVNGAQPCGAAVIRQYSHLWGIWNGKFDVRWKNCKYLTFIALASPETESVNQVQLS